MSALDQSARPFFTPKALAEYLSVSPRSVRRMLANKVIPSYLVGGSRRIDPDDVQAYLDQCRDE